MASFDAIQEARKLEQQATVYLRELAAESVDPHHQLVDPVRFLFREWYYNLDKLEPRTVAEITQLLDSEIGEFMLARCADPRLSIQYNVAIDRMQARVSGTIDRTSSVEWRLRCTDD
jgi:hypothetical protein